MAHLAHARGGAGPQMAMAGRAAAPPQVRPEDIDEIGGVGDELDTISLRDVAAIRYMRHQEWLEMVLGTAIETHKITPPDIIPQNNALFKTNEPQSIKELFDKTKAEVDALEKEAAAGWNIEKPAMSEFYKKLKLHRESDAAVGADPEAYEKALAEFEREFGMTVVERKKVSKITPDLEVNTNGPKKTEHTAEPATVGEPASEPANEVPAEPSAEPSAEPAAETADSNADNADNDVDMDMPLPSAAEDAMADLGDDALMQDMLKDPDDLSDVLNL